MLVLVQEQEPSEEVCCPAVARHLRGDPGVVGEWSSESGWRILAAVEGGGEDENGLLDWRLPCGA